MGAPSKGFAFNYELYKNGMLEQRDQRRGRWRLTTRAARPFSALFAINEVDGRGR